MIPECPKVSTLLNGMTTVLQWSLSAAYCGMGASLDLSLGELHSVDCGGSDMTVINCYHLDYNNLFIPYKLIVPAMGACACMKLSG